MVAAVIAAWSKDVYKRQILPLFELPLACYAGWLIVRHIFRENRTKALLAFLYLQLFMIAAAETVGGATNEWWQVVDIWSGKALAFNIVSPLVLWLLFEIEDCTEDVYKRQLHPDARKPRQGGAAAAGVFRRHPAGRGHLLYASGQLLRRAVPLWRREGKVPRAGGHTALVPPRPQAAAAV